MEQCGEASHNAKLDVTGFGKKWTDDGRYNFMQRNEVAQLSLS